MCSHHWILLVINIDDSSICIYDSLRRGIDKYQTIFSALNRAYKKYCRSGRSYGRCKIDATEFRIFEHKYILRQPEAIDLCGFYVMRYMLYFVEDGYNHRNAEKLGLDTSEILPHVFKALTDEFCGFIRHHVVANTTSTRPHNECNLLPLPLGTKPRRN
ncbi:Os05g0309000 [Oryza sativa Japonica Group]|uniref:Os05g0309000 protein n=1 Tax=Oryza sativa subsp. japonica TaxID=39947 RepID=A0A0P0WKJ2_ORYSJ|nr:Os05g0309000 [Oryza sativa Japonica Group]